MKGRYTVEFGEERKEKIERFRARRRMEGEVLSRIDDAVNVLIDKGLEQVA